LTSAEPGPSTIWIVTDGKEGDLSQAEGLAAALLAGTGGAAERRDVAPRPPWSWWAPHGPPDPREDARRRGSRLSPPFPDLVVATGRRAAPALRALRRLSPPRPFTVFLKDPRVALDLADLVWAPEHDGLQGPNVVATLTAPHRLSPQRLAALRAAPPPRFSDLPHPLVAVALGGPSRGARMDAADIARFQTALARAARQAGSMVVAPSRRTPPALVAAARAALASTPGFVWDGAGENPYPAMLALADAILVTADSHNMASEALATGAPIHVLAPRRLSPRLARFLEAAVARGLLRLFDARLETVKRQPLDCTADIAAAVRAAYAAFRDGRPRPR
jgi:mitochondrial fission protein ELM1